MMKKLFQVLAMTAALCTAGVGMTSAYAYSPEDVIYGTEKPWLFFGSRADGQTLPTYQHTNLFTDAELREIANELEGFRQELAAEGIQFVMMIVPDKETIYGPDYMPAEYTVQPGPSCTEQLVAYLSTAAPQVKVVYPKQTLLDYKVNVAPTGDTVYYETDTHWNDVGGYYGSEELLKAVCEVTGVPYAAGKAPDFSRSLTFKGNLREMAQINDDYLCYDYTNQALADANKFVRVYDKINVDADVAWQKSSSTAAEALPMKLFYCGDSCRYAMADNLQYRLRDMTMVNRFYMNMDWLVTEKPDVFVYQFVERYIKELPLISGYNTSFLELPRPAGPAGPGV